MSLDPRAFLPLPLREGGGGSGAYSQGQRLDEPLPPAPSLKGRGRLSPFASVMRTLLPALPVLLLAACAGPGGPAPGSPQAQANAQTAEACQQRADEVYNMRHRDTIYAPPADVNTPFSGSYAPGVEDRTLSGIYERDSMVSDCERNTGVEGSRTPEQGAPPPGYGPVARP
jgi:hypothetical protein